MKTEYWPFGTARNYTPTDKERIADRDARIRTLTAQLAMSHRRQFASSVIASAAVAFAVVAILWKAF